MFVLFWNDIADCNAVTVDDYIVLDDIRNVIIVVTMFCEPFGLTAGLTVLEIVAGVTFAVTLARCWL